MSDFEIDFRYNDDATWSRLPRRMHSIEETLEVANKLLQLYASVIALQQKFELRIRKIDNA